MTTDCGESAGPATAALVSQLSPRSAQVGSPSQLLTYYPGEGEC